MIEPINFDTSILVFICMGTLKMQGYPKHMWIMTIDTKFEDITFWDPFNKKSYKLKKEFNFHCYWKNISKIDTLILLRLKTILKV